MSYLITHISIICLISYYREIFQRGIFIQKYGKDKVGISTIPYAGSFGQKSSVKNNLMQVTFEELAKNESISKITRLLDDSNETYTEYYYAFTTPLPQWTQKLSKDVGIPPNIQYTSVNNEGDLEENKNIELQFYLGPAGSGAPMHFHGHALNTLAYGKHIYV